VPYLSGAATGASSSSLELAWVGEHHKNSRRCYELGAAQTLVIRQGPLSCAPAAFGPRLQTHSALTVAEGRTMKASAKLRHVSECYMMSRTLWENTSERTRRF
jgi:hypothetical protein